MKLEFARKIDHTVLKPDTDTNIITKLCQEAIEYKFASVCVLPYYVSQAYEILKGSGSLVCTVVGFPIGAHLQSIKEAETLAAIKDGAKEIDMVINIAAMKNGNYSFVESEIRALANICHNENTILKVIVETCLLNNEEKKIVCKAVSNAGADFIKTSTGFSTAGATIDDIKLMRQYCNPETKIKASGGIKTYEFAKELVDAGADRIGTSSGIAIINSIDEL